MSNELRIETVSWESARDVLQQIRQTVFVDEQGVPRDIEWDGRDPQCQHVLVYSGEEPVACARMMPDGKIGRMAVLKAYRRQGVGLQLLAHLVQLGADSGLSRIYLHAQQHASPFYRQAGFEPVGATFEEAGIPHICMQHRIPER